MNRAEPVLLIVLLGLVLATLTVRNFRGRYMASSMTQLDCRLGYYQLMSLATHMRPSKMEENAEWISVTVADGHYLFSKPPVAAHPMVVRRKIEGAGERLDVVTEACAFGDVGAYREAMTKLPPALKVVPEGTRRPQLKAVLQ